MEYEYSPNENDPSTYPIGEYSPHENDPSTYPIEEETE